MVACCEEDNMRDPEVRICEQLREWERGRRRVGEKTLKGGDVR
jgi:hypothetical protein